jgi:hypothetical protein
VEVSSFWEAKLQCKAGAPQPNVLRSARRLNERGLTTVGVINMMMGELMTYFVLGLVVAGVMKLFKIATELSEIKDLLGEIKRNLSEASPGQSQASLASPAHLMRAVNAETQAPPPLYDEELLKKLRE